MKFFTQDIAHATLVGSQFGFCLALCSAPYLYSKSQKSLLRFLPSHFFKMTISTGAACLIMYSYLTKIQEIRSTFSIQVQAKTKLNDALLGYAVSGLIALPSGLIFKLIFPSTKFIENVLLLFAFLEYERIFNRTSPQSPKK